MDFAKNLLEKYGWKQGEGLGKNSDGIAVPLKTSMKQNNHGIGYNFGVEFSDNWWERVFNDTAKNIVLVTGPEGTVTKMAANKEAMTTKRKHKEVDLTYGAFKKKSCLINSSSISISSSTSSSDDDTPAPSNDDIFNICNGRTGHKGSRHGLTLSGKLARLNQQEKLPSSDILDSSTASPPNSVSSVLEKEGNEQPKSNKKKKKKRKKISKKEEM